MGLAFKKNPIFLLLIFAVGCGIFVFYEVKGETRRNSLKVVSYNVGTLNGDKPSFAGTVNAILKEGRPELVLLQEVPNEAFLKDMGKTLGLPHHAFGAYSANGVGYGLGMLSSRPLVNADVHLLEHNGHAVLTAEMAMDGQVLVLCSVHLERVRAVKKAKDGFEMSWKEGFRILKDEMISETPRSMAVAEMLGLSVLKGSEEVIIGGDFNTVPFSTAVRSMERRYKDVLWPSLEYFAGTYTMVKFPIKPRIDYIFCSEGVKVRSARVVRQGGGDHYPVWAELDSG